MASNRNQCASRDLCFLTKKNREEAIVLTCRLRDLVHQLQCSSTRAKGDNTTACFSAGEVSAQEMNSVAEDLEAAARQFREELKKHLDLHELHGLRLSRGRAQRADRDSGVVSWTPPDNGLPIQEESGEGAGEGKDVSSSSSAVITTVQDTGGFFNSQHCSRQHGLITPVRPTWRLPLTHTVDYLALFSYS